MPRLALALALVLPILLACGTEDADPARDADSAATAATADSVVARAELRDTAGKIVGEASLLRSGETTIVRVDARDVSPGRHGVHIHQTGTCDARGEDPFESAGDHLNPANVAHGLRSDAGGHAGDMPNLEIADSRAGSLRFEAAALVGTGLDHVFDRDGSAIVIHADPDDQVTDPSGDSGARIACGVLERA